MGHFHFSLYLVSISLRTIKHPQMANVSFQSNLEQQIEFFRVISLGGGSHSMTNGGVVTYQVKCV